MSLSPIAPQERTSTGISGLDDILGGGWPTGHLYLVEGEPGAGKTTLGLQFLLDGAARGDRCLYITLSETREELITVAASHGWDLGGIDIFELIDTNGLKPDAEQSILHPSELELGETIRDVMVEIERLQPRRVVFDSLSEMRLLAQDALRYRRQILALKQFLRRFDCTTLLLDDKTSGSNDLQLHSLAHGVLTLMQTTGEYGDERRTLRVAKLRGARFRGGTHDFNLGTGGLRVFPRLVAAEHRHDQRHEVMPTGTAKLDLLLGGGLFYGTNTLFVGPSGVGKTTTALSCVFAALERGEKATYYLFDEGLPTLVSRCTALGIPLQPYLDSGQLEIHPLDPAEVSPGQFAMNVRDAVERRGARVIGIDSLNAYLQSMPGSRFLLLQMHELLTYLNQRGVATILILSQHGVLGEGRIDVDLSYLSDALLMFRYFEARGSLLRALSVVKSRASSHEFTIREFRLGAQGIEVGPALSDFEGVLGGITTYRGSGSLLGDDTRIVEA